MLPDCHRVIGWSRESLIEFLTRSGEQERQAHRGSMIHGRCPISGPTSSNDECPHSKLAVRESYRFSWGHRDRSKTSIRRTRPNYYDGFLTYDVDSASSSTNIDHSSLSEERPADSHGNSFICCIGAPALARTPSWTTQILVTSSTYTGFFTYTSKQNNWREILESSEIPQVSLSFLNQISLK